MANRCRIAVIDSVAELMAPPDQRPATPGGGGNSQLQIRVGGGNEIAPDQDQFQFLDWILNWILGGILDWILDWIDIQRLLVAVETINFDHRRIIPIWWDGGGRGNEIAPVQEEEEEEEAGGDRNPLRSQSWLTNG